MPEDVCLKNKKWSVRPSGAAAWLPSVAVIYSYTSFPSVAGVPGVAGVTSASVLTSAEYLGRPYCGCSIPAVALYLL